MNYYAGIGSRETPDKVLHIIEHIAQYMAANDWTLRSGGAEGADKVFEIGCDKAEGKKEIYLPWKGFNNSPSPLHPGNYPFSDEEVAFSAKLHPAWKNCKPSARVMHQRNLRQVVGLEALHGENVMQSKMLICWTHEGKLKGGTGQALRIATLMNIPIFNLGKASDPQGWEAILVSLDDYQNKIKNRAVLV